MNDTATATNPKGTATMRTYPQTQPTTIKLDNPHAWTVEKAIRNMIGEIDRQIDNALPLDCAGNVIVQQAISAKRSERQRLKNVLAMLDDQKVGV